MPTWSSPFQGGANPFAGRHSESPVLAPLSIERGETRRRGGRAFDLLIDHLFHNRGAHRVQFTTALYNKNVLRLVTKAGFVVEGILREYFHLDGQHHDAVIRSLLRHEYYAVPADLRRTDPGFVMPDAVPEADQVEARRIVAESTTSTAGGTSARRLPARVAGEAPQPTG